VLLAATILIFTQTLKIMCASKESLKNCRGLRYDQVRCLQYFFGGSHQSATVFLSAKSNKGFDEKLSIICHISKDLTQEEIDAPNDWVVFPKCEKCNLSNYVVRL